MKRMAVMFGILLVIGAVSAGIGTAVGATAAFQGENEKIEARSDNGCLLMFRHGRLIDNIPVDMPSEMPEALFARGRGMENAVVGVHPLVPRLRMAVEMVPRGARINLHHPTLEDMQQMRENDMTAVDEAIGIVENQKGISVENARGHVMRRSENMEEINAVELWFTHADNDGAIFVHAVVDWSSKEITSFENISGFGSIHVPTENMAKVGELEEMKSIAMQDNQIQEITGEKWYFILPGTIAENEGELVLIVEQTSYTILVDLENQQVISVEATGMPWPPFQMPW